MVWTSSSNTTPNAACPTPFVDPAPHCGRFAIGLGAVGPTEAWFLGAHGIGEAIAMHLAREEAAVTVADVDEETGRGEVKALQETLRAQTGSKIRRRRRMAGSQGRIRTRCQEVQVRSQARPAGNFSRTR